MALIGSFTTDRFTPKDGYLIRDISKEVEQRGFASFLKWLAERPAEPLNIGMSTPIKAGDLHTILSQLRDPPVNNGVKQIDVRDVAAAVSQINKEHGFRDHWVIDNAKSTSFVGSRADDVILSQGGNDRVHARAGDDFVSGGKGADYLYGNDGNDHLVGDTGNDWLVGGNGNDILHAGAGFDRMWGGPGADTFYFDASDFDNRRPLHDNIFDFDSNDQIVDVTGDLKVVAVGRIAIYHGNGTLLENQKTGDRVFVKDAMLTQADIKTKYVAPPPDAGDDTYVEKVSPLTTRLQSSVIYDDGKTKTEVVSVFLRNTTDTAVVNVEDLKVSVTGVSKLTVEADRTLGATYDGKGVFDLTAGGDRTIGAYQEIQAFSFVIDNRPSSVVLSDKSIHTIGVVKGADGPLNSQVGFSLELKVINEDTDRASVELFMKNIGSKQLVDLQNMEFQFTEKKIGEISSVWGAKYYDSKFAVEPWAGDTRPALEPGDSTKLFGMAFDYGSYNKDYVDVHDFKLVSKFDDLLS